MGGVGASRAGDDRVLERNWTAPAGKRIAVPVRIEPKVYFASERTFLVSLLLSYAKVGLLFTLTQKWLQFGVLIVRILVIPSRWMSLEVLLVHGRQ